MDMIFANHDAAMIFKPHWSDKFISEEEVEIV